MLTIAKPHKFITDLWDRQEGRLGVVFRLMKYVLRVDCSDKVLLHNVVTGHLVLLSRDEATVLDKLPTCYSEIMESLVDTYFLVPEDYEESEVVHDLRVILKKLYDSWSLKRITKYTILPTTTCNARCYYCFEQNSKISTMSKQMAYDVAKFVRNNTKGQTIISWFGGEPLVALNRIDQICEKLSAYNVEYSSRIMTNGYLFDKEVVKRAKNLWHLVVAKICVDGVSDQYNSIKSYNNACNNPYGKVMENIEYLLDEKIPVDIRMNFDIDNCDSFSLLADEIVKRFGLNSGVSLRAHPIVGEYQNSCGVISHGTDRWLDEKTLELNSIARSKGLYPINAKLPSLSFKGCSAAQNSAATITPDGNLVSCLEQYNDCQIVGNIYDGIVNDGLVKEWKKFAKYDKCIECVFFPSCSRLLNCAVKEKCYYLSEFIDQYSDAILKEYIKNEKECV